MKRRIVAVGLALGAVLASACAPPPAVPGDPVPDQAPTAVERSYVVMVSLDGMHPGFIERVHSPALDRLASTGVRAEALIPVYPTKTFPNHYSLATGMYPARHGLVDNAFYDPAFDAVYRIGDREAVEDGRWYGGEPIWVAAERQGVTTASYFWVGTEAPIQGVQPTYFKYYDGSIPNEARVDTVLHWLSLPDAERPGLVLLYFSDVDATAHARGPRTPAVDSVVMEVDRVLGTLLDGLDALPIRAQTHVIVVSDHGMADVPPGNMIYLDDLVDLEGVRAVNNTTQVMLHFDGDEDRLWEVFEALKERLENAAVYLRDETPAHWRYRHNPRIGDVLVVAEPGWVVRTGQARPMTALGMHGWDPRTPEMWGIFIASGPRLRQGVTVEAFANVHVHPLVAHLLGVDPAADIDGRIDVVAHLLADPAPDPR